MKRSILLTILISFLLSSCIDLSGFSITGSDDSAGDRNTASNDGPSTDPIDPNIDGDPNGIYNYDGHYAGGCVARAWGLASESCSASLNVYHDVEEQTFGFIGVVNVDMGFTSANAPVAAEPMDIVNGRLISKTTGEDMGEITDKGFVIERDNGDILRFDLSETGGLFFSGKYTDPDYGLVEVEGSLDKLN